MPPKIAEGVYEDLVTRRLSAALDHLAPIRAGVPHLAHLAIERLD